MLVLNDMTEYLEYDAEKTDKFIDDFSHVLNQHESKAAMLYSIYGRYCHNDTFVGDTATKTKLYIAAHQKFLSDNHELQRAIYKKYCDIASNFSDTVDSSPKARIKMSVLKKVKSDYREMSDTLEYHGRKIMNLAQELQDEFGEFGDFTVPDFYSAICEYDEFCGSSGFLDKCTNNLIEFNEWSSDTVDNSGLYDAEKRMQKKIKATVNTLDSMTVYQPDMPQNSIELVALGASVGSINGRTVPGLHSIPITRKKVDAAKLKLGKELKAVSDRDMGIPMKAKDCFNTDAMTLEKVLSLDVYIESASKKYNVDKAMIQAVLYREIRCYGLDDPISDTLVAEGYAYKHREEEYKKSPHHFSVPPTPPARYRLDSSTEPGQIFAETAIDAYNLQYDTNYDKKNWKDLEFFWNKLQDDQYNVEMVAMVLKRKAYEGGYDINNLTEEQRRKVFTRYNGNPTKENAIAYGYTVQDYYNSFSEYNNN